MAKLYGKIIGAVAGSIVLAAAGLPGQTLVSADSDGLRVAQRLAAGMLEEFEIEAIFNGLMRAGKPLYKEHCAGCHGDGAEGVRQCTVLGREPGCEVSVPRRRNSEGSPGCPGPSVRRHSYG